MANHGAAYTMWVFRTVPAYCLYCTQQLLICDCCLLCINIFLRYFLSPTHISSFLCFFCFLSHMTPRVIHQMLQAQFQCQMLLINQPFLISSSMSAPQHTKQQLCHGFYSYTLPAWQYDFQLPVSVLAYWCGIFKFFRCFSPERNRNHHSVIN